MSLLCSRIWDTASGQCLKTLIGENWASASRLEGSFLQVTPLGCSPARPPTLALLWFSGSLPLFCPGSAPSGCSVAHQLLPDELGLCPAVSLEGPLSPTDSASAWDPRSPSLASASGAVFSDHFWSRCDWPHLPRVHGWAGRSLEEGTMVSAGGVGGAPWGRGRVALSGV